MFIVKSIVENNKPLCYPCILMTGIAKKIKAILGNPKVHTILTLTAFFYLSIVSLMLAKTMLVSAQ